MTALGCMWSGYAGQERGCGSNRTVEGGSVGSAVDRATRSSRGEGEGGPISLLREHTGEKCMTLLSASRACARRTRLVVICYLSWVVLEIGLMPLRYPL